MVDDRLRFVVTRLIQIYVHAPSQEEAEALVNEALADPQPLLVTYTLSFDARPVR